MYDIPWPPQFMSFISTMRVFLIDVISITKANCAQPMNYYSSMTVVLVGTKLVLLCLLLGPWLWGRFRRSRSSIAQCLTERSVRKRVSAMENSMAGRRRGSIKLHVKRSLSSFRRDAIAIEWAKVLQNSFVVLLIPYPGTGTTS